MYLSKTPLWPTSSNQTLVALSLKSSVSHSVHEISILRSNDRSVAPQLGTKPLMRSLWGILYPSHNVFIQRLKLWFGFLFVCSDGSLAGWCFLVIPRLEFRALSHAPFLNFSYFSDRISCFFFQAGLWLQSSYLCLLSS
jgi:hypothetical protein